MKRLSRESRFFRDWTEEEDFYVGVESRKGTHARVIGDKLGRTKDSVLGRVWRLRKDEKKGPQRPLKLVAPIYFLGDIK